MDPFIRQRFHAARQRTQGAIALLRIGEQETVVAVGAGADPERMLSLDIGTARLSAGFFHHSPPLPIEIEHAIQAIEDEVSRLKKITTGGLRLFCGDSLVRDIARISQGEASSDIQLSIEEVERVFSLLVGHVQGRPASSAGIPTTPDFAATLLILRELMHHLGFETVTMLA